MSDVTICIPSIPPREDFRKRAVKSVLDQTVACDISLVIDEGHEGAWATRNKAAQGATTEWIGFLDDDDILMVHHVEHLLSIAAEHKASMVWGWFAVIGGGDPWPHYRGRQYNPEEPHVVPITYLIKRKLFLKTGGFQGDVYGAWDLQDQPVVDAAFKLSKGGLFADERKTWWWHHHAHNTSGLPNRWP
jgi:hypothetical protein